MIPSDRPRSPPAIAQHVAASALQDMASASAELACMAEVLGENDLALRLAMAAHLAQTRSGELSGGAAPSA